MNAVVKLAPGTVLLPCTCGLDPVEGWQQRDGCPRIYFVHCPDCDHWSPSFTAEDARAVWAADVNRHRRRLGLSGVWA